MKYDASNKHITVFIVDDHQLFRQGLKLMLSNEPNMEVIGECGDGRKAIQMIQKLKPDVTILDISMPGLGGLELVPRIKKTTPETEILMVSMYDNPNYVYQAFKAGCKGYVLKSDSSDELKRAIRIAARGESYISPGISSEFIKHMLNRAGTIEGSSSLLTSREQEICRLVLKGYGTQELAEVLFISPKTVRVHLANIMKKLSCKSRTELIIKLQEMQDI